jgi:tryptophanyl-tRNA synthetase
LLVYLSEKKTQKEIMYNIIRAGRCCVRAKATIARAIFMKLSDHSALRREVIDVGESLEDNDQ